MEREGDPHPGPGGWVESTLVGDLVHATVRPEAEPVPVPVAPHGEDQSRRGGQVRPPHLGADGGKASSIQRYEAMEEGIPFGSGLHPTGRPAPHHHVVHHLPTGSPGGPGIQEEYRLGHPALSPGVTPAIPGYPTPSHSSPYTIPSSEAANRLTTGRRYPARAARDAPASQGPRPAFRHPGRKQGAGRPGPCKIPHWIPPSSGTPGG